MSGALRTYKAMSRKNPRPVPSFISRTNREDGPVPGRTAREREDEFPSSIVCFCPGFLVVVIFQLGGCQQRRDSFQQPRERRNKWRKQKGENSEREIKES